MKKKYLFLYYPGARGDFLASILIGDILKTDWTKNWITYVGVSPYWCKMHGQFVHNHGPHYFFDPEGKPFTSFDDYTVIRISLESDDYEPCLLLAKYKMSNFYSVNIGVENHEQYFSSMNNQFSYIVPFKDLFNIDKIEDLFFKFRNRKFTDDERRRVLYNIELQYNILNSK